MKALDAICGWVLFALGVVHCTVTFFIFRQAMSTDRPLWFFSGGLLLILVGLVNWLRRADRDAWRVRRISFIANLMALALAIWFTWLVRGNLTRDPQSVVLILAIAGETYFSARTR